VTRAVRAVLILALSAAACGRACGRDELPVVTEADGRRYRLLDKGLYKAFYSMDGKLQRLEYDNNGDGRPEQVDFHDGLPRPRQTLLDANSDGKVERWEWYDASGHLTKVALSAAGGGQEQWVHLDAAGLPTRWEYDTDRDGKVDRTDVFSAGLLTAGEFDSDRDGKVDRWQRWSGKRLEYEDLDIDRAGRPDRRLLSDDAGNVTGLQSQGTSAALPARP
jgi:hypothetical protein